MGADSPSAAQVTIFISTKVARAWRRPLTDNEIAALSKLYSDALREYVSRHAGEHVTEALDKVCADVGGLGDAFASTAGRRGLRRAEW